MKKLLIAVALLVLALTVVSAVYAQEEVPNEESVVEAEIEPVEEEGADLGAVTEDFLQYVVVGIMGVLAVVTNEVAFEKLISLPLVEPLAKGLKAYQPYMVLLMATGLLWLTKVDVYAGLAEITNMLNNLPGDSNYIAGGAIVGLLSLAYHDRKKAA